jgi:hypothetical protein
LENKETMLIPLFVLLNAVLGTEAITAVDSLQLTSSIVESQYCLEANGAIGLKLMVQFTYHNVSGTTVVLPRFSRLAGYAIFRSESDLEAGRAVSRVSFDLAEIFHATMMDPAKPPSIYV